tara:strand:- start:1281 stop:1454 length:174 start_codon:yes stop_codon:yes gene_type:complete
MTFDPSQESMEEYLRRIHLKDKINKEWNYDEEEKANAASDVLEGRWAWARKLRQTSN